MSNLFESLRKAELIGADEFALPAAEVTSAAAVLEPVAASAYPGFADPIVIAPEEKRTANLRVSALSPIFPFDEEHHAAAEQYRIIRTKILHHQRQPRMLVVSSGGSGDGKTITSINIAASFALKSDVRVALIDGDMRRPQIANLLGLSVTPGLSEVLSGAASFEEAGIYPDHIPNLCILPAGNPHNRQAELLDSERWHKLTATLRHSFDYVIVDAPPIAAVADYELLQVSCDGVVLVARPEHSDRKIYEKTLQTVPKEKLIGVVLNCVDDWFLWRTRTYGYYTQG